MPDPISVLCIYRVKPGKEEEFKALLARHWSTLDAAGLVTAERAKVFFGATKGGKRAFIEMFQWRDAAAPGKAHESAEVMSVWEPMGALVDDMEFLQIQPVF